MSQPLAVQTAPNASGGASGTLPGWRSLLHEHYVAASALRFTAEQPVGNIGVPNALRVKLALLARLQGRQERTYAALLRRSVSTENPNREGILKDCLLFEADNLSTLRNHRGNNFRDQVSKALLEAGALDTFEHPSRSVAPNPLLTRTVAAIIRARIGAIPLDGIESWLMKDREPSVKSYFYRVLLHLADERRDSEPEQARRILSAAPAVIFEPTAKESARDRVLAFSLLNPAVLEHCVKTFRPDRGGALQSDLAEIRRQLSGKRGAAVRNLLERVPSLQALTGV